MPAQLLKLDKTEKNMLPVASGSSLLETYYLWLKHAVKEMKYGEVGIHFTIHSGMVVSVEKNATEKICTKQHAYNARNQA